MKKKLSDYILALDFDGVIWNGVEENWETYAKTYQKMNSKFKPSAQFKKKFLQGRYLCRTGNEFYLLFKFIEKNPKINFLKINPRIWENLKQKYEEPRPEGRGIFSERKNLFKCRLSSPPRRARYSRRLTDKKELETFASIFYNTRHELQKTNFKHWIGLQYPYRGVIKEIKKLQKLLRNIFIATAKDRKTVEILLKKYKLNLEIISREFSMHKDKQMRALKNKLNINFNKIIFLDDFLENLEAVKKLGCRVIMAGWGYNTPFIRKKAAKLKIPVLKLKNLAKQVIDLVNNQ